MSKTNSNIPEIRFPGFTDPWEQRKCDRILKPIKGAMKIGPFGSALKKEFYTETGVKVYAQENIFQENFTIGDYYISEERYQTLKGCKLEPGDLVISMMGTIGACAIFPNNAEPGIMNSHLLRLQLNDDIYPEYIHQLLRDSQIIRNQIDRLSVGSIMSGLSSSVVQKLVFPVPSITEQRKIAGFLLQIDKTITLHQRKCDELKYFKKGLLQQMFPQPGESIPRVRFPGFTGSWEQRKCEEIFDKVGDPVDVIEKDVYREIGIRSHGKGIFHKDEVTGKELGNKRVFWVEPNCFVVNIVFAWERAVAKTTDNENGMIASHRFPMYRPKVGVVDLDYITKFFTTNTGKAILELASPGGAGRNKTLGQKEFANSKIWLPSYEEQRKIGRLIDEMDNAITLHQCKCDELKIYKKGLLQHMFI